MSATELKARFVNVWSDSHVAFMLRGPAGGKWKALRMAEIMLHFWASRATRKKKPIIALSN